MPDPSRVSGQTSRWRTSMLERTARSKSRAKRLDKERYDNHWKMLQGPIRVKVSARFLNMLETPDE